MSKKTMEPTTRAVSVVASIGGNRASDESGEEVQSPDFIGPSQAVKSLFSVPYATDKAINVAVHNIGGTLLIDGANEEEFKATSRKGGGRRRPRPFRDVPSSALEEESSSSLSSSSSSSFSPSTMSHDALALVTSMLNISPNISPQIPSDPTTLKQNNEPRTTSTTEASTAPFALLDKDIKSDITSRLPRPEQYPPMTVPSLPREYLRWKFHEMMLLVGSDALVYRQTPSSSSMEALAVRMVEGKEMRELLRHHEKMVQEGQFRPDHEFSRIQQMGKQTYAQALETKEKPVLEASGSFSAPDLDRVQLQTCILPTSTNPLGGHFSTAQPGNHPKMKQLLASTPVCTVLDAYLDNIMANVPQLALCLREKGFIQSVKLLETQDIPSNFLVKSTLDTSSTFSINKVDTTASGEPLFSPQIMEMNAATLLRFLKANCSRDNSTYLLQRQAGDANIQLYDISSISAQRQRKWIWWLAMMSYRFALRLGQLSSSLPESLAQKRSFRARQRSLLQNALNLLEDLADMDGGAHETLCSAVCENLADTFLSTGATDEEDHVDDGDRFMLSALISSQPYARVSVDALNKAHDYLNQGIKFLQPLLEQTKKEAKKTRSRRRSSSGEPACGVVDNCSSSDDESVGPVSLELQSITLQLFGLHHKFINVSLRLAEHHLKSYWSSSAMQALRTAAHKIVDARALLKLRDTDEDDDLQQMQLSLRYQLAWLWEHCGHFARSFAADTLWRERGHACGEDIVSVLRDVEAAFCRADTSSVFPVEVSPITLVSNGCVTLSHVSSVVDPEILASDTVPGSDLIASDAMVGAEKVMNKQKLIQKEQRCVLVAACIAYSLSISSFESLLRAHANFHADGEKPRDPKVLNLLRQRLGDSCNEIGKILLNELRRLMTSVPQDDPEEQQSLHAVSETLLCSAKFWFERGLEAFGACRDLRNIALLRCNLCQCCKFRANSHFAASQGNTADGATHAEVCLQEAADHLQKGHESLGERHVDPMTWDMVSQELAATFLVLGVRRRQSILGGGSTPVILPGLRLSPGKERSIVEPMEKALKIYELSQNAHQAAATHYQLALFYSKVWTCQRDESKTREKLAAAFMHFTSAHAYFSHAPPGNESTFVLLCLDLSNLYSAVSGEECTSKALARCLDAADAFSPRAVSAAVAREEGRSTDWFGKMATLSSSVEERVFRLLMSLVKIEKERADGDRSTQHKDLYRVALTVKMAYKAKETDDAVEKTLAFYSMLMAIKNKMTIV